MPNKPITLSSAKRITRRPFKACFEWGPAKGARVHLLRYAAALCAIALSTSGTFADPTVLKFATLNPPQSHLNVQFIKPWTARINAAAPDELKIEPYELYALASNVNVYDRVLSDVAQIGWGLPIYFTGKFVTTNVTTLPFTADKSVDASLAYWRMYARGDFGTEYSEIHPLVLIVFPQSGLHMAKREIRTLDDLKGTKIRTGSKVVGDVATALGATPISIEVGEMYQSFERGLVDGTIMPWTAFQPFKMQEVTHFHVDVPLGAGSAMIFMAKKRYEGLSAAARKALDDNTGEAPVREFGRFWDRIDDEARAAVKAMPGHTVKTMSPAEFAPWRQRVEPVLADWVKETPNGAKVLETFRAEIAKAAASR
jgi:TRAP-type C4-dicarboxylate transport system substrate-binding protein